MNEYGETQKGLNGTPKLSNIAHMDEGEENQKGVNGTTKIV